MPYLYIVTPRKVNICRHLFPKMSFGLDVPENSPGKIWGRVVREAFLVKELQL